MTVSGLLLRYLVDASRVPRMTTQQAAYSKTAATQQAVAFYRCLCITRTGRIETAVVTQPGAEQEAVSAN
jgi:hypothetical protein